MNSTSIKVRNTANGSLLPDSASSVAPTRGRGADARTQPKSLGVHQKKHRGGVGRGHHGADQQRLGPVQVERKFRDRRRDQCGQQHADGRQHDRWRKHRTDVLEARPQAAVEQDQRQRDRTDQIGGPHVVELELAGSGIARQHADHEKHQKQRRAEAQRQQARQDASHHERGAEQDSDADGVERGHEKA
jgi:hypothetical protein